MNNNSEFDKKEEKEKRKNINFKDFVNAFIIIAILAVLFFAILYVVSVYSKSFPNKYLPKDSLSIIEAVLIAVFGVIAINVFQKSIFKLLGNYISDEKAGFLRFIFNFILYFTLILFIFTTLGIDITNILLGATFLGVILGMASQALLSNLFAGFAILFGKPFKIGDRITVVTWQWGLLMSTYQHEAVKPGYTGIIKDINILFTTITEDNGFIMKAPNNILMNALVTNYSNINKRLVRVRFELDKTIDFDSLKAGLFNYLKKNAELTAGSLISINPFPVIRMVDLSLTSYFVAVEVWTPSIYEDPLRDLVLSYVLKKQYEALGKTQVNIN